MPDTQYLSITDEQGVRSVHRADDYLAAAEVMVSLGRRGDLPRSSMRALATTLTDAYYELTDANDRHMAARLLGQAMAIGFNSTPPVQPRDESPWPKFVRSLP